MSYNDEESLRQLIAEKKKISIKSRDSFIFYRSWYKSISRLNVKETNALLKTIIEYNLDRQIPKIDKKEWYWIEPLWELIKPNIDANIRKYENGCKGGRPKKNKPK